MMDYHLQRRNICLILCPELVDHYIDALDRVFIKPKTIIQAASLLSFTEHLNTSLSDAGLDVENELGSFFKKARKWAADLNAQSIEMYDPQCDPYTAELQKDGEKKLFVWDEISES